MSEKTFTLINKTLTRQDEDYLKHLNSYAHNMLCKETSIEALVNVFFDWLLSKLLQPILITNSLPLIPNGIHLWTRFKRTLLLAKWRDLSELFQSTLVLNIRWNDLITGWNVIVVPKENSSCAIDLFWTAWVRKANDINSFTTYIVSLMFSFLNTF